MDDHRILIVDDQREVREVLRSAIETLGDFKIIDVPSGEEALLEISTEAFDLLVTDVRLPGISGLELLEKLRGRNPDMAVIIVTGTMDANVRRQVADAGAEFFFLKPIEPADFLDAVERSLGLVEAHPVEKVSLGEEKPTENVSEHLTSLRKELDAFSTVLLDERGRVLAQAGDLPDASMETALFPALMAAFSAGERVANLLRVSPPRDLMYFSGAKYDLFLAHVGESYALLIAVNPVTISDPVDRYVRIVYESVDELMSILASMGVPLKTQEQLVHQEAESTAEPSADVDVDDPLIESLFQMGQSEDLDKHEVDSFWQTASLDLNEDVTNADALSYEQARQLGLTPKDEAEEE
jgi:CheY-like chemotaxis protein